jgi:hypothetical protein
MTTTRPPNGAEHRTTTAAVRPAGHAPDAARTAAGARPGTDRRRAARIAGWGYVALFALAVFANFMVVERLVVAGDPAATTANIEGSVGGFRLGLLAFLVIFVIDVVVAWALHIVFRDHDADRSLLAAWSRLVYTVFLGVGLVFFFRVLYLVDGAGAGSGLDRPQMEAQVAAALDSFDAAWLIGLAIFGLHLGLVGSLVLTSRLAPRALGALLIVAGAAYVVDTVCRAVLADYGAVEDLLLVVVAVPSVVAEGWFGLWLLLRAGRDRAVAGSAADGQTPVGIAHPAAGGRD